MTRWIGLLILGGALVALAAYAPTPVQRSAAEQEFTQVLTQADSDSAKLRLARKALADHPEDIPLARAAQDVLLRYDEDPVAFFKGRADGSESIAARYLYARASGDTTIMAEQAAWILQREPQHFWGLQLAGIAEWNREQPDLDKVERHLLASVTADPSRPEGYMNLGYLYEEKEQWQKAREVFEAGAVADPAHTGLRDARLTVYAEQRDAQAFFDLFEGSYPNTPLTADMPIAGKTDRLTTEDLRGAPTVLEYWAYT